MAQTSVEQARQWAGPAILGYGFRPFFFGAALWAALAMALWVGMLAGRVELPTALDPVSWHAHEFLFGYLGAVIAGFLLTAVPNWTGRRPVVDWRLGGLAALWLAGRFAVALSAPGPLALVAAVDLAFPVALALVIAREIVAGRNWRNLIVLGMLGAFAAGNAVFHLAAAQGSHAAAGLGPRIGLGVAIMMIAVIGGRIIPSFARNRLAKQGAARLPAPPMQALDKAALLVLLVTHSVWVPLPQDRVTVGLLLVAGGLHLARLARWRGLKPLAARANRPRPKDVRPEPELPAPIR